MGIREALEKRDHQGQAPHRHTRMNVSIPSVELQSDSQALLLKTVV